MLYEINNDLKAFSLIAVFHMEKKRQCSFQNILQQPCYGPTCTHIKLVLSLYTFTPKLCIKSLSELTEGLYATVKEYGSFSKKKMNSFHVCNDLLAWFYRHLLNN